MNIREYILIAEAFRVAVPKTKKERILLNILIKEVVDMIAKNNPLLDQNKFISIATNGIGLGKEGIK